MVKVKLGILSLKLQMDLEEKKSCERERPALQAVHLPRAPPSAPGTL